MVTVMTAGKGTNTCLHALLALVLCTDLKHALREDAVMGAVRIRVDLNDVVVTRREVRRDIPLEVRAVQ